jgi:predicted aspartyl protease
METFTVSFQVGDLAGQKFVDVEALVDTGSTYTVLPKEVLDQLGIEQEGQRSFELGDD